MVLKSLVPMAALKGGKPGEEALQMDQRTIKAVNVTSTSEATLGKDKARRRAQVATIEVGHTHAKGTLDALAFNQTTSTTTKVQTTDSKGTPTRPVLSRNTQNVHGVVRVEGWAKQLPEKPPGPRPVGPIRPLRISVQQRSSVQHARPAQPARPVQPPSPRPIQPATPRPVQPVRPAPLPRTKLSVRIPGQQARPQRRTHRCCRCVPCPSRRRARQPVQQARILTK